MLGAFQDSRLGANGRKSIKWGVTDLFILFVYIIMCLTTLFVYREVDPKNPGGAEPSTVGVQGLLGHIVHGYQHASGISSTSYFTWAFILETFRAKNHNWYLLMVLQARFFLFLGEILHAPGWLQTVVVSIPSAAMVAKQSLGHGVTPYWGWEWWYVMFYVAMYHYVRPTSDFVTSRLPSSPTWGALAASTSLTLGMVMAMYWRLV